MAKSSPNSSDVYFQLGVAGLMENKYKDAEDAFKKSYQLNPANPKGLFGVVQSYLGQNEPDQALGLLRTEVDKQPNRLDLRELLANTEVLTGKFDNAVTDYSKVMDSLDKNSKDRAQLYFRIGETYRRKGDNANAISNLQKAREVMPENADLLTHLGLAFDQAGRWNEAKQVYEATIKINSNNGPALNNLAFILAEHGGDLDDALSKAQKAKQLMPNLAEVSDTLGWIYVKKQQSDAAIDILKDLVTRVPKNATFRFHLAMAFNEKGDRPKAIQELQEALKNNPTKEEKAKIQEALGQMQGRMAAAM
jgi:tetratricopeptide (TPR) repeat protein